jgi:hypothetical protein
VRDQHVRLHEIVVGTVGLAAAEIESRRDAPTNRNLSLHKTVHKNHFQHAHSQLCTGRGFAAYPFSLAKASGCVQAWCIGCHAHGRRR